MNSVATFPGIKADSFTMPDGQPHLIADPELKPFRVRISSPNDLMNLGMLRDIFFNREKIWPHRLDLMYLMGGRMDRAISAKEPYTLRVVANFLNSLEFQEVRIFAPHSQASTDLVKNSSRDIHLESSFYDYSAYVAKENWGTYDFSYVVPDEGACKRFEGVRHFKDVNDFVICRKKRELSTGKIKEFKIVDGEPKKHCLIVDDLCDGGATFIKVAEALREKGAEKVGLAVCHGVFSRGLDIPGIDMIVTTDSFFEWSPAENFSVYSVF